MRRLSWMSSGQLPPSSTLTVPHLRPLEDGKENDDDDDGRTEANGFPMVINH